MSCADPTPHTRDALPINLQAAPIGRYGRWRRFVAGLLLLAFYGLPWLRWGNRQAILFDLSARRFDFFGLHLLPKDAAPLLCLILAAIAGLCLITTVYGRIWCAFGCPQRILGGLYRFIQRRTTFKSSTYATGILIRHVSWAAISLWTGLTFVAYFSPLIDRVLGNEGTGGFACTGWEIFWAAFYTTATWLNVVYLREQACRYLCPYARLQGLLSDGETPHIRYEARRGEPRGSRPFGNGSVMQRTRGLLDPNTAADYVFRAAHPTLAGPVPLFSPEHLGDCVDCGVCTRACPMQIDIRNGSDPHCLQCGACIDACEQTMSAFNFPVGLLNNRRELERPPPLMRPKVLSMAAIMMALLLAAVWLGMPAH